MGDFLRVELTEHSQTELDPQRLVEAAGMDCKKLSSALDPLVTLVPSWGGKVVVQASSEVGTVQVNDMRVDVRPRLAAAEMATLIRYVFGGPVAAWRRSWIGDGRVGLDELLCSVFADELTALRQGGLSRQYVDRREPLPVLRGRVDFLASFPWNERGMTTVTCRYHELTCDNLDNQLLRAALERATLMDTTVATRRRLLEHRRAWSELAALRSLGREHFAFARARYTRLSEHYRLPHNLAELILLGRRPSTLFDAGGTPTGGVYLNMAELFELFVERLLGELLRPRALAVRSQQSDQGALLDGKGHHYRSVRPDLLIFRGGVPIAVVDAKYKDYWPAEPGGLPVRKISNDDLYQLFFYTQRLQLRHRLAAPPSAFIVSPLPAEDERLSAVIGERFTVVKWMAGGESPCEVNLLLLPLTNILRQMNNSLSASSAKEREIFVAQLLEASAKVAG